MVKEFIENQIEMDPAYMQLKQMQEAKVSAAVDEASWYIDAISEVEDKAENGDVEAMYRCFQINALHESFINRGKLLLDGEAIKWLKKAVDKRYTEALVSYINIGLTGYYLNEIEGNYRLSAQYAYELCQKFTDEALKDEDIQEFIEAIKKLVDLEQIEEEKERKRKKSLKIRGVITLIFFIILWFVAKRYGYEGF